MKYTFVSLSALPVVLALCLTVRGQSDLERKVEEIFLYQPQYKETYDKKAKLQQLGREDEVKAILLNMLAKYKYSQPGTKGFLYLKGAAWMLGELEVKQAQGPLSQVLFDRRVDEDARAWATKSLGQIDAEANKQLLLKALASVSDYYMIRVYAAEGLAKTKDPEVLKALEQYSRQERDAHVRQQFQKAAQQVRAKISG